MAAFAPPKQWGCGTLSLLLLTLGASMLCSPGYSADAFGIIPSSGKQMTRCTASPRQTFRRQSHIFGSASAASRTTTKTRNSKSKKKKHGKSKTSKKQQSVSSRPLGPGRSITQDELSNHVNGYYSNKMAKEMGSTQSAKEYLKQLNSRPSLVLNADYQPMSYLPLSLWSWQDAVKAIFNGKVTVVDVYPDITVRAANIEVPLPSVIALTDYVSHTNTRPAFTRRNVFLRDEYKCQYCNDRFHTADLSLDHVVPRSVGGVLSWENAVTSCLKCNGRKGSMPVSQLSSIGMKLLREPRCPTQMELAARAARMVPKRAHPTWKPYLGIAKRPPSGNEMGDEEFIDDRYFEAD